MYINSSNNLMDKESVWCIYLFFDCGSVFYGMCCFWTISSGFSSYLVQISPFTQTLLFYFCDRLDCASDLCKNKAPSYFFYTSTPMFSMFNSLYYYHSLFCWHLARSFSHSVTDCSSAQIHFGKFVPGAVDLHTSHSPLCDYNIYFKVFSLSQFCFCEFFALCTFAPVCESTC